MPKALNEKKMRRYGIGIDSGGTFTDGVIVDLTTGAVTKTVKVPTTHNHLLIGIRNCLHQLDPQVKEIAAMSLSTTLATNSVIEGKGADVGVFLIGQKEMGSIPAAYCFHLEGGHDSQGEPLTELDLTTAQQYIEQVKDKVSAFAISGFMSVRNPQHEKELKDFILKNYGIPVICGHELSSTLGAHERAVTAALNGRLLPVIKELIDAVKQTMTEKAINAPLLLVRGDGSLVMAETALARPIETMLSGPAASLIGARFLSNVQDAIVADMGGTTTDTAVIHNGLPMVSVDGARVGGFLTRVKAVDINTIGLGGDSHVQIKPKEGIILGPQRVVPISAAVMEDESVYEELQTLTGCHYRSTRYQPVQFVALAQKGKNHHDIPADLRKMLQKGLRSIAHIGRELATNPDLLPMDQWINSGLLAVAGLTPTDFKVAKGEAVVGSKAAAKLAIELTCRTYEISSDQLEAMVMEKINKTICATLLKEAMGDIPGFTQSLDFLINDIFEPEPNNKQHSLTLKLNLPVIAVGAPVQAYYPSAMNILGSPLLIPEHAEVANAVGAITGQVVETVELLIRPDAKGYTLYTPWGKYPYTGNGGDLSRTLAKTKAEAETMAKNYVLEQAKRNGGHNIEIYSTSKDIRVNSIIAGEDRFFLECRVKARAIGCAYKSYSPDLK